jgi:hypothetical protein
MDGGIAGKPGVSRRLWTLMVGLGVLLSITVLWRCQVHYQARQQKEAAKREARLAAFRMEEEARQMEAERKAAKARAIARVSRLYREINNLTQLSDQIETSLRERPRVLGENASTSQATP